MDNLKRKIFIKYELKRLICKNVFKSNLTPNTHKYYALYKRTKLNRWSSLGQQNNRCFRSGRNRAVNKLTRMSRFVFRTEAYLGHLPGFNRASW